MGFAPRAEIDAHESRNGRSGWKIPLFTIGVWMGPYRNMRGGMGLCMGGLGMKNPLTLSIAPRYSSLVLPSLHDPVT